VLRDDLAVLLQRGGGDARGAAREALLSGGAFTVWDGEVPASRLAGIYDGRRRRTEHKGIATIGLGEAIARLEGRVPGAVRLGKVVSASRDWVFVLFLSVDASEVIACTGVRQSAKGPALPK
jgi:hypothetical protein